MRLGLTGEKNEKGMPEYVHAEVYTLTKWRCCW